MTTLRNALDHAWLRLAMIVLFLIIGLFGVVWAVAQLGSVPQTQQEAEAHLNREILAYAVWDGMPYAVFEYGGTVHFDRLILDWISIEWPPTPRWQWTGFWSSLEPTTDQASVELAAAGDDRAIYGQVNSAEIVRIDVLMDGEWHSYPASSPGFAIRLPSGEPIPEGYRWLDAEGNVIWTVHDQ